jgi:sugar phosphate permease
MSGPRRADHERGAVVPRRAGGQRGGSVNRRAVIVWAVGLFAYIVAVFHRTSLGVAGVAAAHRFGIGASVLATLSVIQLAVYAAMQIPVGVLLDRYGSRRLLVTGSALMGTGQLLFALATRIDLAILARLLLGAGDAMMFISLLRLVALWMPPGRNPIVVQLTGVIGQLGSLASAVPMVLLLRGAGWTATYLTAAGLGALAMVLVVVAVRDAPAGTVLPAVSRAPLRAVRAAWSQPGTRLGLWTHFGTQFSACVFGVLWGYPFLVDGEGLAPGTAALLLSLLNIVVLGSGPLMGQLVGRWPYHRSGFALVIVGATASVWTAVLLWPGRAPVWLLVTLVAVLAVNGPASMIGFDFARSFNPRERLGSASGIVNVGGFGASILTIIGIGVVLDLRSPGAGGHYPLSAFRWAFALQYLIWAAGAVQILRLRRLTRRHMPPATLASLRRGVVLVPADAA